jgi:Xaa-Pro dipeptidase
VSELARAAEALRRHGLDAVLLSTPPAVTYVSGWAAPLPGGYVTEVTGWLPPLALVTTDGGGTLIVSDDDAAGARASALPVRTFDSLNHFEASDPAGTWERALREALRDAGITRSARLGVEPTVPRAALAALGDAGLGDASAPLAEARALKTPREVERLHAAVTAADAAQRRLVELAPDAVGATELEVWAQLTAAMQASARSALTITGVLITGPRTAFLQSPGPTERTIRAGDLGLLDVGGRVDGYWSDSANTVVFGGAPTPEQQRHLDTVRRACEAGIAALRPGKTCAAPATALRDELERGGLCMAHYAGHQLGTSVNEPPRLLPFATERIEEGMVFAVEAGAYEGEGGAIGARCEQVAVVTAAGPELLSSFAWA